MCKHGYGVALYPPPKVGGLWQCRVNFNLRDNHAKDTLPYYRLSCPCWSNKAFCNDHAHHRYGWHKSQQGRTANERSHGVNFVNKYWCKMMATILPIKQTLLDVLYFRLNLPKKQVFVKNTCFFIANLHYRVTAPKGGFLLSKKIMNASHLIYTTLSPLVSGQVYPHFIPETADDTPPYVIYQIISTMPITR